MDWPARIKAMCLHSALHLLDGPFEAKFKLRAEKGFVTRNDAYLIFKENVPDETVQRAIEFANKDIETGLDIKSWWDEKKKGYRWVQVGNYTAYPDGGLHIKNTKEIGKIKLVSKILEEGKCKVTISVEP